MSAGDRAPGARPELRGESFTTRELARLTTLSPARVRRCVHAGILQPRRGKRDRFEYPLQDLLLLRAARTLLDAPLIGPSRLARIVARLREGLPAGQPVTSLRLHLEGDRVFATDGRRRWDVENGQMSIGFASATSRRPSVHALGRTPPGGVGPEDLAFRSFARALLLEKVSNEAAREAYREALDHDPRAVPALVNLGRLEHEAGHLDTAERLYTDSLQIEPQETTALYNLALLAEDRGDNARAVRRYRELLANDPRHADGHRNMSRLLARLGRHVEAQRHNRHYRAALRGH